MRSLTLSLLTSLILACPGECTPPDRVQPKKWKDLPVVPLKTKEPIVAFSPDGKYAAFRKDKRGCLWDLERDVAVFQFDDGKDDLGMVRFSPSGTMLVVGHAKETAIYEVPGGKKKQ